MSISRDTLADSLLLLQYKCMNFNPRPFKNNNTLHCIIRVMYTESVHFTNNMFLVTQKLYVYLFTIYPSDQPFIYM